MTTDPTTELYWVRDGDGWVLKLSRRKLGRVFTDAKYPNMWRSRRADGRLSDMANLSWAKAAVLDVVARDLTPPKPQQIAPVFETGSPPMRQREGAA